MKGPGRAILDIKGLIREIVSLRATLDITDLVRAILDMGDHVMS